MHQGSPLQISKMVSNGDVDFAIASEDLELFDNLVVLPCYSWNFCVITPKGHNLNLEKKIDYSSIAKYPIVTYVHGFCNRSKIDATFKEKGLKLNIIFTASDADLIKTYVRLGFGIGIIAKMAIDSTLDSDLSVIDIDHLFQNNITSIGFRKDIFLRGYMQSFIESFAPHLSSDFLHKNVVKYNRNEIERMIDSVRLPHF